jgi:hypothetical protein
MKSCMFCETLCCQGVQKVKMVISWTRVIGVVWIIYIIFFPPDLCMLDLSQIVKAFISTVATLSVAVVVVVFFHRLTCIIEYYY